eukprot:TRINITY_DN4743_c0_g1_i6.p1 TRINITY_DN4743_c0_g1~~TRINITY_DN4743_c0_g1_i6.p1  ORF type:complete len:225 (+),score=37.81 TRINITY_DN4743_c0_g1_i6:107-781(+)
MEWAPQSHLFEWITQRGSIREAEVRAIGVQLLQGIYYLHSFDIIYAALKPENVLISTTDQSVQVKLGDFGMYSLFTDDEYRENMTSLTNFCCTAPELLAGRNFDHSIDIWSLGVLLYILLCGYPPYCGPEVRHGKSVRAPFWPALSSLRYEQPLVFHDPHWTTVSPEAKQLLTQMLSLEPSQRPSARDSLQSPWFYEQTPISNEALKYGYASMQEFMKAWRARS